MTDPSNSIYGKELSFTEIVAYKIIFVKLEAVTENWGIIILKMTEKSELGKTGEDFACDFLVGKGYKIIERNFRKPWGELDIVAMASDKTLVFIEVKTMREPFAAVQGLRPEDQMTAAKLKKFKKAASLYAGHNQNLVSDKKGWRLDVVAIAKTGPNFSLNHYENIYPRTYA